MKPRESQVPEPRAHPNVVRSDVRAAVGVGRGRVRILVRVARALAVLVRLRANDREVDLHELGLVGVAAHAVGGADVRPEPESAVGGRVGVVRHAAPLLGGHRIVRRPPARARVGPPVERRRGEAHRVAGAVAVAEAAHQVRDLRPGGGRVDPARDQKVLPLHVHVPVLLGSDGVSAVKRRVRRVEHGRIDDLGGARPDLDFGPRIEARPFVGGFVLGDAVAAAVRVVARPAERRWKGRGALM